MSAPLRLRCDRYATARAEDEALDPAHTALDVPLPVSVDDLRALHEAHTRCPCGAEVLLCGSWSARGGIVTAPGAA